MAIDWKSAEALEDLLVAFYLAGAKPDWAKVATFFGRGATYHSVEGFMRKIRQRAERRQQQMIEEMGQEAFKLFTSPSKQRTPRTPVKTQTRDREGVRSGKVQKTTGSTKRTSACTTTKVKAESTQSYPASSWDSPGPMFTKFDQVIEPIMLTPRSVTANGDGQLLDDGDVAIPFDLEATKGLDLSGSEGYSDMQGLGNDIF